MVFFMIEGKEVDYELPFIKLAEGLDHRKIDIKILYPATKMTLYFILDEEFLNKIQK